METEHTVQSVADTRTDRRARAWARSPHNAVITSYGRSERG